MWASEVHVAGDRCVHSDMLQFNNVKRLQALPLTSQVHQGMTTVLEAVLMTLDSYYDLDN